MEYFSGEDYLKIAVANHYGLDKKLWQERIEFTEGNSIDSLYKLSQEAEEPVLMRKAIRALEASMNDQPVTLPVALDATQSGIQILSCLSGCTKSGSTVNLVDPTKRKDFYGEVAASTNGKFTREELKQPVMTSFYGSKAEPIKIFGKGTPELAAYYEMLASELTGAYGLLNDIQSCWQSGESFHRWEMFDGHTVYIPVVQDIESKVEIDTLDGMSFTHRHRVIQGTDTGISLAANLTHSVDAYVVREVVRRASYNLFRVEQLAKLFAKVMGKVDLDAPCPMDITRVISTDRIYNLISKESYSEYTEGELHHINYRLHSMLRKQPYKVLPIHDSFAQHPNFCNATRHNYANILTEIAATDSIQFILRQITGDYDLVYEKDDGELWKIIQNSNYALT